MDVFKVKGQLGDVAEEMDAMDEQELKNALVNAASAMKQAKDELEANREYTKARDDVKTLGAGKRDLDKYQKAKTQYALYRLEELGKMPPTDRMRWDMDRIKVRRELEEKAAKALEKKIQAEIDARESEESEE